MLKHYLLITFRNFKRTKSTFMINLIGLSSGLASTLLICLWVNKELNVDKFHIDHERIFQVMEHNSEDGSIRTSGNTTDFLATTLAAEMPEVEYSVTTTPPDFFPAFTLSHIDHHIKGIGKFSDRDFLKMFTYPLIEGNVNEALKDKNNLLITESAAKSLFGTAENCVGKVVEWRIMDIKKEATIAGILRDLPANASEKFDFIATFDSFKELMGMPNGPMNWDIAGPFSTFVVVRENADVVSLDQKIGSYLSSKARNAKNRTLFLKAYTDKYLYGKYENGKQTGGRIQYVVLFSALAIVILFIACINFINLSTAKAISRAKESGIKKAMGVKRKSLIFQYFLESMVMTSLAMGLALLIALALLPQFNLIIGEQIVFSLDRGMIIGLASIFLGTSLLAGSYPAFYLSGFNPVATLKGQIQTSLHELTARKSLVVIQFVASVTFIIAVVVLHKQIQFVAAQNPGYDKNNILYFETEGKVAAQSEAFLAKVKAIPHVVEASSMLGLPVGNGDSRGIQEDFNSMAVNYDMLELLKVEVKMGRSFSRTHTTDVDKVILNEAAVEALGIADPIGKVIQGKEILGVVGDFHYRSLHDVVKPLVIRLEPGASFNIMVRYRPGEQLQTIKSLTKLYTAFNPGFVFSYGFLDTQVQGQYWMEKKISALSTYAAGLAIVISCLGLIGLVSFTTEKRSKEISIRKVLGSTELGIVFLLSSDFSRMVGLGILIAMPTSYFTMRSWLDTFAYRIDLSIIYFLAAALGTLFLSWLLVASQAIRAARVNPATGLRSE